MKVTALEEYGLRCMLLFVEKGNGTPLTIPEISSTEKLSIPYAGKLLMILKQAGLVKAVRGRKGGYILSKPAQQIPLREIFSALGEPFFGNHHCGRYTGESDVCVHDDDCRVRQMWSTFDRFINGILGKVTLADLANGKLDFLESKELLLHKKETA
ncbi:MAG: Rrf2 family transcriptional regulator [Candidatus Zixiibacteriota bacterium]